MRYLLIVLLLIACKPEEVKPDDGKTSKVKITVLEELNPVGSSINIDKEYHMLVWARDDNRYLIHQLAVGLNVGKSDLYTVYVDSVLFKDTEPKPTWRADWDNMQIERKDGKDINIEITGEFNALIQYY